MSSLDFAVDSARTRSPSAPALASIGLLLLLRPART
jgi:hypothetical protein